MPFAHAKTKAQISCAVSERLCFCYINSTIPLLSKSEAIFCGCTAWFVSDLFGNPEGRFSHDVAHLGILKKNKRIGWSVARMIQHTR